MLNNFKLPAISKNMSLYLKGVAVILMVLHHARTKDFMPNLFGIPEYLLRDISLACKLCVPIFVFITGYAGMMQLSKKNNSAEYTKKRIFSIWKGYIPYFIISMLFRLTYTKQNCWLGPLKFEWCKIPLWFIESLGLQKLVLNTNGINGVMWYISTAYLLVFLMPVLKIAVDKLGFRFLILTSILPFVLKVPYDDNSLLLVWLPITIQGMLWYKYSTPISPDKTKLKTHIGYFMQGLMLCMLSLLFYHYTTKLGYTGYYIRFWAVTPVLVYGILCFFRFGVFRKLFELIGKYSFGLYLSHVIVLEYFWTYINTNWLFCCVFVLVVSLILVMSLENSINLVEKYVFKHTKRQA